MKIIFLVAWILIYKLGLNARFYPSATEYHITSTIPIILLFAILLSKLPVLWRWVMFTVVFVPMFYFNLSAVLSFKEYASTHVVDPANVKMNDSNLLGTKE